MSTEAKSLGVQNHTGTDSIFPWAPEGLHNAGKLKDGKGKEVKLFTPLKIRDLVLKNRIFVSPMCQYSSPDGFMTDWHFVHYGAFAVGGAGLVCVEATAVAPAGRISPYDSGLWKDEHIPNFARIVKFIHEHQAAAAIQIGHAGRKASTNAPWMGTGDSAVLPSDHPLAWQAVGPSAIPFSQTYLLPKELTKDQIKEIQQNFVDTAIRADKAGFDVLELHGAHGYLMSSFCSPNSNTRTDEYGGSFENRTRFILETVRAVRKVWPAHKPLFIRLSCNEWVDGGWDIEQTVKLAAILKNEGVDAIDCSSGGINSAQKIAVKPSFQVPYAEAVRKTGLLTAAVGLITEPKQAEEILQSNQADLVALGRVLLRNPRWAYAAAVELGVEIEWAPQYERAKPRI